MADQDKKPDSDNPALNANEDETKDDATLWAELEASEQAALEDSGDKPESDDAAPAATPAAAAADSDDDDKPAGKQPAGDEPAPGQKPAIDLWANASDEQRAAFEAAQRQIQRLEQSDRSQRGRLSAMQRQLNSLMTSAKPAADQAAGEGKQSDGEVDPLTMLRDEYPEIAGPVGALVSQQQSQISRLEKVLSAIGIERQQAALAQQETLLSEAHADWRTVMAASEQVAEWLETQPRHVREAAERNGREIVDAEEAADVVGRYKAYLIEQGLLQPADASASGSPTPQLSSKRKRQLESATGTRSRGPGVASGIPENGDEETLWKQFDQLEEQQQRAGRV